MTIAELIENFIGKKYEIGKTDCFHVVYDYLASKMEIPKEFKGQTLDSYKNLYNKSPEKAINLMIDFLKSYLQEIEFIIASQGDIVLLNYNYQQTFLGIIVGNANVLLITISDGVQIIPLRHYKILRVFRCPD